MKKILVNISDLHIGSTAGLCHKEGFILEDGGLYNPSVSQFKVWEKWEEFWAKVSAYKADEVTVVVNGEFCDGFHHNTTQVISSNVSTQIKHALKIMRPIKDIAKYIFATKGTEAHTGSGGSTDEIVARELGCVQDKDTGEYTFQNLYLKSGPTTFDIAHHVRNGEHGILTEVKNSMLWGNYPTYIIRGHVHQLFDTGQGRPVRGLVCPSWQLKTHFTHRVTRTPVTTVGGLIFQISEDGSFLEDPRTTTWEILPEQKVNLF